MPLNNSNWLLVSPPTLGFQTETPPDSSDIPVHIAHLMMCTHGSCTWVKVASCAVGICHKTLEVHALSGVRSAQQVEIMVVTRAWF